MPSSDRETYKNNPTLNRQVKRRDLHACIFCGSPDNIQVHHYIPRVLLETLKIDDSEDFMVTVCDKCHTKRDTDTRRYFEPYLNYMRVLKNQVTIWDLLDEGGNKNV